MKIFDTEFDQLLQDLRIVSNRRYQSQCWLKFRKANGLVPAPTYKWEDSDQLRGQLQSPYIRPDSILTSAMESTKTILYKAKPSVDYADCIFIAMYSYVKPYLLYEIQMFGDSLLRTLDGATLP